MIPISEVRKHASKDSCWITINTIAYDVTSFLDSHPGGSHVILKYAGQDATAAFEPIHPSDTLGKYLKPQQKIGSVAAPHTPGKLEIPADSPTFQTHLEKTVRQSSHGLGSILNIQDFERAAAQRLSAASFAFFKSGADDERTRKWNRKCWQTVRFRPRVLRPIEDVEISTTILGTKFSAPFFICPTGGARLAHPEGDVAMTMAAAKHDILHWVCNNASCTQNEISAARAPDQTTYWQIYAMSDLSVTENEVRHAIKQGYKAFALTVDAVRPGNRERVTRMSLSPEVSLVRLSNIETADIIETVDEKEENTSSVTPHNRAPVWAKFDWVSALLWLRELTDLPIVIKGIQCWEDAELCMQHGAHPWLSNHAGRQLEDAPSALDTLMEIRENCPQVLEKCEVIVDGGITRGTDVVKALALGAKSVGLGRAFLFSLAFGQPGVSKAIQILKQEVETAMVLLGVDSVAQLNASYVTKKTRACL